MKSRALLCLQLNESWEMRARRWHQRCRENGEEDSACPLAAQITGYLTAFTGGRGPCRLTARTRSAVISAIRSLSRGKRSHYTGCEHFAFLSPKRTFSRSAVASLSRGQAIADETGCQPALAAPAIVQQRKEHVLPRGGRVGNQAGFCHETSKPLKAARRRQINHTAIGDLRQDVRTSDI